MGVEQLWAVVQGQQAELRRLWLEHRWLREESEALRNCLHASGLLGSRDFQAELRDRRQTTRTLANGTITRSLADRGAGFDQPVVSYGTAPPRGSSFSPAVDHVRTIRETPPPMQQSLRARDSPQAEGWSPDSRPEETHPVIARLAPGYEAPGRLGLMATRRRREPMPELQQLEQMLAEARREGSLNASSLQALHRRTAEVAMQPDLFSPTPPLRDQEQRGQAHPDMSGSGIPCPSASPRIAREGPAAPEPGGVPAPPWASHRRMVEGVAEREALSPSPPLRGDGHNGRSTGGEVRASPALASKCGTLGQAPTGNVYLPVTAGGESVQREVNALGLTLEDGSFVSGEEDATRSEPPKEACERDLADIRQRVYHASFAAKFNDVL